MCGEKLGKPPTKKALKCAELPFSCSGNLQVGFLGMCAPQLSGPLSLCARTEKLNEAGQCQLSLGVSVRGNACCYCLEANSSATAFSSLQGNGSQEAKQRLIMGIHYY